MIRISVPTALTCKVTGLVGSDGLTDALDRDQARECDQA